VTQLREQLHQKFQAQAEGDDEHEVTLRSSNTLARQRSEELEAESAGPGSPEVMRLLRWEQRQSELSIDDLRKKLDFRDQELSDLEVQLEKYRLQEQSRPCAISINGSSLTASHTDGCTTKALCDKAVGGTPLAAQEGHMLLSGEDVAAEPSPSPSPSPSLECGGAELRSESPLDSRASRSRASCSDADPHLAHLQLADCSPSGPELSSAVAGAGSDPTSRSRSGGGSGSPELSSPRGGPPSPENGNGDGRSLFSGPVGRRQSLLEVRATAVTILDSMVKPRGFNMTSGSMNSAFSGVSGLREDAVALSFDDELLGRSGPVALSEASCDGTCALLSAELLSTDTEDVDSDDVAADGKGEAPHELDRENMREQLSSLRTRRGAAALRQPSVAPDVETILQKHGVVRQGEDKVSCPGQSSWTSNPSKAAVAERTQSLQRERRSSPSSGPSPASPGFSGGESSSPVCEKARLSRRSAELCEALLLEVSPSVPEVVSSGSRRVSKAAAAVRALALAAAAASGSGRQPQPLLSSPKGEGEAQAQPHGREKGAFGACASPAMSPAASPAASPLFGGARSATASMSPSPPPGAKPEATLLSLQIRKRRTSLEGPPVDDESSSPVVAQSPTREIQDMPVKSPIVFPDAERKSPGQLLRVGSKRSSGSKGRCPQDPNDCGSGDSADGGCRSPCALFPSTSSPSPSPQREKGDLSTPGPVGPPPPAGLPPGTWARAEPPTPETTKGGSSSSSSSAAPKGSPNSSIKGQLSSVSSALRESCEVKLAEIPRLSTQLSPHQAPRSGAALETATPALPPASFPSSSQPRSLPCAAPKRKVSICSVPLVIPILEFTGPLPELQDSRPEGSKSPGSLSKSPARVPSAPLVQRLLSVARPCRRLTSIAGSGSSC
ncbi:unnamed protein product, partial [Polarella glacialis]